MKVSSTLAALGDEHGIDPSVLERLQNVARRGRVRFEEDLDHLFFSEETKGALREFFYPVKDDDSPHPDDFIAVTIELEFRAKPNPDSSDPPELESIGWGYTIDAKGAVEVLEEIIRAIRERRLYGYMAQQGAEAAVSSGEWIEKTVSEIAAEERERAAKETAALAAAQKGNGA